MAHGAVYQSLENRLDAARSNSDSAIGSFLEDIQKYESMEEIEAQETPCDSSPAAAGLSSTSSPKGRE